MSATEHRRLPRPTTVPTLADEVWAAILQAVPETTRRPELLDTYTPAIRQVHAMSLVNAEVLNGGFSQFFYNGGGVWLDDAIDGFAAAGLDDHRRLAKEAADAAIAKLDALQTAQRRASLEAYSTWNVASGLGGFDDRWYVLEDVTPVLDRFVRDHAADIWAE